MKVMAVFGTRPEAIKLAPVLLELRRRASELPLQVVTCVTAQHRQMLDQVLQAFGIQPDYDLEVMDYNQSPGRVASAVLSRLEPILRDERPDWVVVQGDTTTVAAASLAAFYEGMRVAHVEAGLRTHDKWRPFPEEINRRIAGVVADLHFAPTERARRNLLREGVPDAAIIVTGNPVIDALHHAVALTFDRRSLPPRCADLFDEDSKLILVTAHRRENFGRPLENICRALRVLADRYDGRLRILYPVHLNPNVWDTVHRMLDGVRGITLVPPLDYLPLVYFMKRCYMVLTDSGGIQEEAPGLGKPVLVLRDVTERPEAVEAGTVRLVGTDWRRIVDEASLLIEDPQEHQRMARAVNPYGDGRAARRIVSALIGETVEPFIPASMPADEPPLHPDGETM